MKKENLYIWTVTVILTFATYFVFGYGMMELAHSPVRIVSTIFGVPGFRGFIFLVLFLSFKRIFSVWSYVLSLEWAIKFADEETEIETEKNAAELKTQIEALESLEYKTFWTFEGDEPRMKTVVIYSDVVKAVNDRKNAIFAARLVETMNRIFSNKQ
jgi:hypothetical protein